MLTITRVEDANPRSDMLGKKVCTATILVANISICMASRLRIVSSRDSPLTVADVPRLRLRISAESLCSASSNVDLVRVLASKNKLATVLPRRMGTFLTMRSVTEVKDSAVSSISVRIWRFKPSMLRKCRSLPFSSSCGLMVIRLDYQLQRLRTIQFNVAIYFQLHGFGDYIGLDWNFAFTPVD